MSNEHIIFNKTMSISPASKFWSRVLELRNITKNHIEIHRDDDDLTCVVIVGVGIAVMIVMLILNKYLNDDRPRCCLFTREV